MDVQQAVALVVFFGVYALVATRLVHRAAAALVGALVLFATAGPTAVISSMVPQALLVTAGLMVLAGFVKRSGLAAWLALKAAKAGRGRPTRILLLTGLLSFVFGAALGPAAAVVLVVPVSLLLAVELDVSPLPFVVALSWTALLGGTTTLTAQPANLWLGAAVGVDGAQWLLSVLPFTATALVVTLIASVVAFRKMLRVTNERRARVLEYDEGRSLEDRPLLVKTLTIFALVVVGLVVGPWLSLPPSLVVVGGAVLLTLWEGPRSVDRSLAELDMATLLFFGALFAVVGAVEASGLWPTLAEHLPATPWTLLWGTALLSSFVDQGSVVGALVPLVKAWQAGGHTAPWVVVAVGAALGGAATVWGAASTATALALAGQGAGRPTASAYARFGVLFAVLNLAVVSLLLVWGVN